MIGSFNAEFALTADTFSSPSLSAMIAIETRHTCPAIPTGTTVWSVSAAPGIIALIARLTRTAHTLADGRINTVLVGDAAYASRSVDAILTNRRRPAASGVVRHIAGRADRIDALVAIAIAVT